MTLPPPPGTLDYAIWAYTREMERAEAERQRKAVKVEEEA